MILNWGNYSQAIPKLKSAIKLDSIQRNAFILINRALYEIEGSRFSN